MPRQSCFLNMVNVGIRMRWDGFERGSMENLVFGTVNGPEELVMLMWSC